VRKLAAALIGLGLLGMGSECEGDKTVRKDGDTEYRVFRIASGTTFSKAHYGAWKATGARPTCRWTVTKNGKVQAKGGPKDAVLVTRVTRGAKLTAKNCGWFYR
jgi:hypothetical protein